MILSNDRLPHDPHAIACICANCLWSDTRTVDVLPDGRLVPTRVATLACALRAARAESDALAGLEQAARMHAHGAASNPSEWCPICKALGAVDAARAESART